MDEQTRKELKAILAETEDQLKSRQPKDDARAALRLVHRMASALLSNDVRWWNFK